MCASSCGISTTSSLRNLFHGPVFQKLWVENLWRYLTLTKTKAVDGGGPEFNQQFVSHDVRGLGFCGTG